MKSPVLLLRLRNQSISLPTAISSIPVPSSISPPISPPLTYSKTMPTEKWNSLSEFDKSLLLKLGFIPEPIKEKTVKQKKEKTKNQVTLANKAATRSTAPTPYYITTKFFCHCCKHKRTTQGIMELPFEFARYLKYREIDLEIEEINFSYKWKQCQRYSITCSFCVENLHKFSKEELVQKYITQYNNAAYFYGNRRQNEDFDNKVALRGDELSCRGRTLHSNRYKSCAESAVQALLQGTGDTEED